MPKTYKCKYINQITTMRITQILHLRIRTTDKKHRTQTISRQKRLTPQFSIFRRLSSANRFDMFIGSGLETNTYSWQLKIHGWYNIRHAAVHKHETHLKMRRKNCDLILFEDYLAESRRLIFWEMCSITMSLSIHLTSASVSFNKIKKK